MKVTLYNIKCHDNKTVEFDKEGISLLLGQSGVGKSTILQAIYFALYGVGHKIITHDKTNCKVILEYNNLIITRTKNPSRLTVNDLSGLEAQLLIDRTMGTSFEITGYIPQNAIKSFVLMNSYDKLSFLEKCAPSLCDIDLEKIKQKCKNNIKEKNDEIISLESKYKTLCNIEDVHQEPEYVEMPSCLDSSNTTLNEQILKKYIQDIDELNCNTNNISKVILNYTTDIDRLHKLKIEIDSNSKFRVDLLIERDNLNDELSKSNPITKKFINSLNRYFKWKTVNKDIQELEHNIESNNILIEDMKEKEIEQMKQMKHKYQKKLDKIYEKYISIDSINKSLNESSEQLINMKKISKIENKVQQFGYSITDKTTLEKRILEFNQQINKHTISIKKHKCPGCNSYFHFTEDNKIELLSSNEIISDNLDIDSIKEQINIIKNVLKYINRLGDIVSLFDTHNSTNIDDISRQIQKYNNIKEEINICENNIKKIDQKTQNNEFSTSITILKQKNDKYIRELSILLETNNSSVSFDKDETFDELNNVDNMSYDELQSHIRKYTIEYNKQESINIQINTLNTKINNIDSTIRKLLDEYNISDPDEINTYLRKKSKIIEQKNTELQDIKQKIISKEQTINSIKEWVEMKRQLDNYNNMQTKINDTYLCINNTRKEYAAACKLYTSLLESESVVITNLIQNINDHARIYLEHFFVNDLMSAELMTFKSNKKNVKPQINIQIHHKGMESDINMLSGGELSRVVLAFTLALAEIFNTPLLLLDECTSSLDQELANDVFEVIKENFKGKTVIIVAHQVVTGIFDKIITI